MTKRNKIYKIEGPRTTIGQSLKDRRVKSLFSLTDAADMTGFPQSTISSLESGVTTNIDYYISYAQALDYNLSKLFEIQIEYKPRFDLSANKKNRLFLTKKIKELLNDEDFFKNEASVIDVIKRLGEKYQIKNSNKLSTDVSRILLNWVNNGTIKVKERRGRANIYIKVKKNN